MDKNKILNKPFVCVKWVLFLKQCSVTLSRFATYCRRILYIACISDNMADSLRRLTTFSMYRLITLGCIDVTLKIKSFFMQNTCICWCKVNAFENVSKYILNHLINVSIYTFLYSNWLCKNEQKYFHDFIIHYNFI